MISVKILVHASMTALNLSIACCAAKRSTSMFTSRRDALVLCEPAERVKKVMEASPVRYALRLVVVDGEVCFRLLSA
jgi:hypothetical protein